MQNFITLILFAASLNVSAQTLKNLEDIESSYQTCLDQGNNMKGCSIDYYKQADSLLNVVYKNVKLQLNSDAQAKLTKEQRAWLKKRDAYFQKLYLKTKKEGDFIEGSADFDMIILDKKATFVMERLKVLISRI